MARQVGPKAAIASILRRDVLSDMFFSGRPQPVGTCLYPTSRNYDIVRSRSYDLGAVTHTDDDSRTCSHHPYVDDGGLYDVEPHDMEG